jgi:predicted small lipoprotein YifL
MLNTKQILVSAIVLASSMLNLTACGQMGPLFLPAKPAVTEPK